MATTPSPSFLGNGDGTFQTAVSYPVGPKSGLDNVVVADFNGDGKPDLAVSVAGNESISIFLGNGDGTFQTATTIPSMWGAQWIAAGDFNGDGKVDLAVLTLLGIQIFLGKGDGTFTAPGLFTYYSVDAGTGAIAVADFNGDHKLDLAVVNQNGSTVSVLRGNGDGTFQAKVDYTAGNTLVSITAGDFNGDGKPDLAVVDFGSSSVAGDVAILLGNGDGSFQAAVSYPVAKNPQFVTIGDFNGDGIPDLAIAKGAVLQRLSVLLGNGDGSFQAPWTFGVGSDPTAAVAADFNLDGKMDIASANSASGNKYRGHDEYLPFTP